MIDKWAKVNEQLFTLANCIFPSAMTELYINYRFLNQSLLRRLLMVSKTIK